MIKKLKKYSKGYFTNENLKFYILNGVLFTIMSTLSRSYAVKFLDRLGGTSLHVSLFNALPGFIAIFATLPGILFMNKSSNKKAVMGKFFIGSRFFCLLFALVPFFPPKMAPMAFVILTALMNFPESVSLTALQSYSGDIFLPSERATAISLKNKFSTLAQVIFMFIMGTILSLSSDNKTVIIIYQILFIIAFFIGLLEIMSFFKLKEKSCNNVKLEYKLKGNLKEFFRNKKFNSFLLCSLLFHFGWQMGWPLFNIYQINYLGANEIWLTILNVTSTLVMVISFNFWNNLIRKKGNPFVIAIATLGMAATPILFALSPNLYVMTITGLVTGFFTSGTITVILSSLLEAAPENQRIIYVGLHATFTNITLAIAPIIGNYFLSLYNIYIALIVTSVFRLVGSFAFYIRYKFFV